MRIPANHDHVYWFSSAVRIMTVSAELLMIFYNKTLSVLPHFSIFIWKECVDTDFPLHAHWKLRKLHNQCFPICIHTVEHNIITDIILISPCIHIPISRLLLSVPPFHGKPLWILISGSLHAAGFVVFTQDRIIFPQANHIAEEIVDFFVFFQTVPIQP